MKCELVGEERLFLAFTRSENVKALGCWNFLTKDEDEDDDDDDDDDEGNPDEEDDVTPLVFWRDELPYDCVA